MKLTFCGGARTVTGSSYLLEAAGKKLLIDCGLFQGGRRMRERNFGNFLYDPAEIDYVILTHAHIDHSGLIPRLVKMGFRGRILATKATVDLASIMLQDSAFIQEMEAEWQNRKNRRSGREEVEPLYTVADAKACLPFFEGYDYYETYTLSPEIRLRFYDAGHILGSAIVELWVLEDGRLEKLVFSGDLGKPDQPIIRDPDVVEEADFVVIEGTYGARIHEHKKEKLEILERIINETVKQGGNIVVPAFAVGRTQELLYYLNQLIKENKIPNLPIYIDSPLAISATEIFARHPECFDIKMRQLLYNGRDPFNFPEAIYTRTMEESRAINELPGGVLIISASGMAEAGRIKHHLKHNLWRKDSTILFVGYQGQGTLGRRILDGAKKVTIFGEEIAVKARIACIDGFSAHADRNELLRWLRKFIKKPRQVILVHGEEDALVEFSAQVERELGMPTYIPSYLETVELKPDLLEAETAARELAARRAWELMVEWKGIVDDFTRSLERKLMDVEDEEELLELEKQISALREKLAANF